MVSRTRKLEGFSARGFRRRIYREPEVEDADTLDESEDDGEDETFGAESSGGGYTADLSPRVDSLAKTATVHM